MSDLVTGKTNVTIVKRYKNMGAGQDGETSFAEEVAIADKNFSYETVAASATGQTLGGAGAAGDYLEKVVVFPALVACGVVTILDGATVIATFPGGGTTALVDCKPFVIPIGAKAVTAWKITTGVSVAAIGIGHFSA